MGASLPLHSASCAGLQLACTAGALGFCEFCCLEGAQDCMGILYKRSRSTACRSTPWASSSIITLAMTTASGRCNYQYNAGTRVAAAYLLALQISCWRLRSGALYPAASCLGNCRALQELGLGRHAHAACHFSQKWGTCLGLAPSMRARRLQSQVHCARPACRWWAVGIIALFIAFFCSMSTLALAKLKWQRR